MRRNSSKKRKHSSAFHSQEVDRQSVPVYEIEVAEGLENVLKDELLQVAGENAIAHLAVHEGALQFQYAGPVEKLLGLKTVISVYTRLYFDVPRPRALLGHEHFQMIVRAIDAARRLPGTLPYQTIYVNAAGSDSSVMRRLKAEIAQAVGMSVAEDEGDLLVRIRRAKPGWDVLVRLSPRPLATRSWRVCNLEGALNAAVAHAMHRLIPAHQNDTVLNLACGSGTLMIERLQLAPARRVMGCDIAPSALECARANIQAAGYDADTDLICADARFLPFPDEYVNIICADLPFGQLVGSHDQNRQLYPQILAEAARVARPESVFVVITHEVRLMESLLRQSTQWRLEKMLPITLRGLHPRIYLLRKIKDPLLLRSG